MVTTVLPCSAAAATSSDEPWSTTCYGAEHVIAVRTVATMTTSGMSRAEPSV